MRIYFAGPLFSAAERDWNATLATALRTAGHEVFLPQEQEPGKDAPGIFATDVGGIDWANCLVAIMDGADPDSGTCWEVGYAYQKKPIVLLRTDMRRNEGSGGSGYNPMLTEAATIRIEAVAASIDAIAGEVLQALATLEPASAAGPDAAHRS
jgi:nucleoside 2-deoxyribosyltransferase